MMTFVALTGLSLALRAAPARPNLKVQATQATSPGVAESTAAPAAGGLLGAMDSFPGPAQYPLGDIPSDLSAYEVSYMTSDPFAMLFSMGGSMSSGTPGPVLAMMPYLSAIWSRGEELNFAGQTYLVGYAIGNRFKREYMFAGDPYSRMKLKDLNWERVFINEKTISEIEPEPELTTTKLSTLVKTFNSAPTEEALQNIKQLILGVIMFATDNDDKLPTGNSSDELAQKIYPYIKNQSLFKSLNPNGGRINFILKLGGIPVTAILAPQSTIFAYDSKPWPDGTYLVAYCDGHSSFVPEIEFQSELQNSQSKSAYRLSPSKPPHHVGPKKK